MEEGYSRLFSTEIRLKKKKLIKLKLNEKLILKAKMAEIRQEQKVGYTKAAVFVCQFLQNSGRVFEYSGK